MYKAIRFAGLALIVLSSCKEVKNDARIEELTKQLDSTQQSLGARDSLVSEYLEFITAIETNLNEIRERESMISLDQEGFSGTSAEVWDKMIRDLQKINELMADNKEKLAVLDEKLKGSQRQIVQLKELVEQLKKNYILKETQVLELNKQVTALMQNNRQLKISNDSLLAEAENKNNIIAGQAETIEVLGNRSSMAYVATGTAAELQKKNIIARSGGFLGIGAVPRLNENLDWSELQLIDTRNVFSIPIHCKTAKLITLHPTDSYRMEINEENKNIDKLMILDPKKFWGSSRCLVVVTR